MTHGSHESPDDAEVAEVAAARRQRVRSAWRVGTPVALLLAGGLFVVSARNSDGTDLRPGRYTDLAALVRSESERTQALQDRVATLNHEVDDLARSVKDERVATYRSQVERLSAGAGLRAESGPGLSITLSDAPEEVRSTTTQDRNLVVVHQQDIQAVVNALWAGGATAVTVEGQRIISTTGIKCEGNAVQLAGIPYPQPYVIQAVGDQDTMAASVDADPYIDNYREQTEVPDIDVGFAMTAVGTVEAPAYDGLLDLAYAQPITGS